MQRIKESREKYQKEAFHFPHIEFYDHIYNTDVVLDVQGYYYIGQGNEEEGFSPVSLAGEALTKLQSKMEEIIPQLILYFSEKKYAYSKVAYQEEDMCRMANEEERFGLQSETGVGICGISFVSLCPNEESMKKLIAGKKNIETAQGGMPTQNEAWRNYMTEDEKDYILRNYPGQKVQAIVYYRNLYGVGLKDGKDAIDTLM